MRARPFLSALAVVLAVTLTGFAALTWATAHKGPMSLVVQPLNVPKTARFIPQQADLALHWLGDPARLPAYAQAVAPDHRRREARETVASLRTGLFALASIDYERELRTWLGPEVSAALLIQSEDITDSGWILVLSSRDRDGARQFLQRFWQTRSFAGAELQTSQYRGVSLISGRGTFLGREPQTLATALVDDELLLASSQGILKQALDNSQFGLENQLEDGRYDCITQRYRSGVALLSASPRGLEVWLGMSPALTQRSDLVGLVATLSLDNTTLQLDGSINFSSLFESTTTSADTSQLLANAGGAASALALLSNPADLLIGKGSNPLVQWIRPILRRQLGGAGFAASAVAELDRGPLLWLQEAAGWAFVTSDGQPDITTVDAQLTNNSIVHSSLPAESFSGEGTNSVDVWTYIARQRGRGSNDADALRAELVMAHAVSPGQSWWSNSLAALQQRHIKRDLQPRLAQVRDLATNEAPKWTQQVALNADLAAGLLSSWRPWILMQTLAGRQLLPSLRGLALAVAAENPTVDGQGENHTNLQLRARLSFG
ncbi:hypothetical protein OMCYN_00877 [cyanobiont of Ornithocercus magnificus]|nr:hypothetical protein OMCYN_00877 [cyanobiont of Ornithocercus magnificus]